MINEIEHLFMGSLALWISSLVNTLSSSFAHVFLRQPVWLFLRFSSSYFKYSRSESFGTSVTWRTFLPVYVLLFILFIAKEQNWKTLMKSTVSIFFSFMDNAFVVLSKNPLANPRQKRVSPSCPSISCLILSFILSSDQLWDHFYKVWVSLFPPYGCSIISAPFVEKTIKKKIF